MTPPPPTTTIFTLLMLLVLLTSGCALHYYDADTGTEHLWGFGHLKMKRTVANEGVQAVITGIQTLGIALDTSRDNAGFSLGYQNTNILTAVAQSTAISLEGPSSDPFTLQIGSHFGTPKNP